MDWPFAGQTEWSSMQKKKSPKENQLALSYKPAAEEIVGVA